MQVLESRLIQAGGPDMQRDGKEGDSKAINSKAIAADVDAIARITAVPNILEAVTRMTGMRFAAVARVTDSQWIACAVRNAIGFPLEPGGELPLETTICNEIRQHHQPVVFGHASTDPHYGQHHTPRLYGLESYISLPIFRTDGSFFGTLCAIDSAPAELDDPNIVGTLKLFAELIGRQLEIEDRLSNSQAALKEATAVTVLREQFVTALGQNMRDPLQAIITGLYLLKQSPSIGIDDRTLVVQLEDCSQRMDRLIRDILDFAAGQLGVGMPLAVTHGADLGDDLRRVVAEVATTNPSRSIVSSIAIDRAVNCDRQRMKQLLANVLVNAVAYGGADQSIEVDARIDAPDATHPDEARGMLRVQVRNGGEPIPASLLPTIFEPHKRLSPDGQNAGLGLGLFIAAEIARAHGGTLELTSTAGQGTQVTFQMPLVAMPAFAGTGAGAAQTA